MIVLRDCAEHAPIRLTRGLAVSFAIALVHSLLFGVGLFVGNLLVFGDEKVAEIVFFGIVAIVSARLLIAAFGKKKEAAAFDISRWSTVLALAVATGTNTLIIGLATGFVAQFQTDAFKAMIPLLIAELLLAYLAVMYGRQKVKIRPRRWYVVSVIFILMFALRITLAGD